MMILTRSSWSLADGVGREHILQLEQLANLQPRVRDVFALLRRTSRGSQLSELAICIADVCSYTFWASIVCSLFYEERRTGLVPLPKQRVVLNATAAGSGARGDSDGWRITQRHPGHMFMGSPAHRRCSTALSGIPFTAEHYTSIKRVTVYSSLNSSSRGYPACDAFRFK